MENIIDQGLPTFLIFKLGGSVPYIKFGSISPYDWQFFKVNKNNPKITERVEWVNLIEKGKLILPLRHIRLLYKDNDNKIIKWEFAFTHCINHGCRATLDTKSYFIYGPENQLEVNNLLSSEITCFKKR